MLQYSDLLSACIDLFKTTTTGIALNETLMINNVPLQCHIYHLKAGTVIKRDTNMQSIFSLCKRVDMHTQIILCHNMLIQPGAVLTPPYRCKGLVIFDAGKIENSGTITMTQRGASAEGQNIYLYQNQFVPAVGANGAASVGGWSGDPNTWVYGGNGSNGTGRQTGGGGGAIAGGSWTWGNVWYNTGRGGNGTSYSGGTGAGQYRRHSGGYAGPMLDVNGSNTGGQGGHGSQNWDYEYSDYGCPGGVGNPCGRYTRWTGGRFTREISGGDQNEGTGGLLVIYSQRISNDGTISSEGTASRHGGAGSSGGGSINIFYGSEFTRGTISAKGGQGGRYGGDGTISIDQITLESFSLKEERYNSNFYKDAQPGVAFDFEKLFGNMEV